MHNDDRKIYVRFRVRVTSAVPVPQPRKAVQFTGALRGDITSIDLFLDREMTEPLIRISLDDDEPGFGAE